MLTIVDRYQIQTLTDAISLWGEATETPALIYVETGAQPLSVPRRTLRHEIEVRAKAIQQMGIRPHDMLAILHSNTLEGVYIFWGAMMAGAIPAIFPPLTEKLIPEIYLNSIAQLVRRSDVRAVVTSDEFLGTLNRRISCPVFGSSQLSNSGFTDPLMEIHAYVSDPEEIAFLQHSSGTTGLQKGVALTHRAVLNQIKSYSEAIRLDRQDVIVSWLPLYHDMGLIAGFLLPLVQGIPLVLMSPMDWVRNPALLFQAIHDYQGTLCWQPNFAYNHCARRIRPADTQGTFTNSMRMFINCSEPVYHESHQLFLDRFVDEGVQAHMLAVSYAMAENTFAATQSSPGTAPRLDEIDRLALERDRIAIPVDKDHPRATIKVSSGRPIDGTEIRVLNPRGQPVPERRVGEMALRSNCMLSEYYKRPDISPMSNGWYLTGDMGYMADGEAFVIGRQDDLIIHAGRNIYPQDVEAIVNTLPGIRPGRAVAFGVPDSIEGTELIAVVAEVEESNHDERKQIDRMIRQAISQETMVVASYISLVDPPWIIKTSSGKLARDANRQKWILEKHGAKPHPHLPDF